MQTNHSALFVAMGGAMGGAKAVYCGFLECWAVPIRKGFLNKTDSQSINQL